MGHPLREPSHPQITREELDALRQELGELAQIVAPSRTLIALNRFYVGIESYFSLRGLSHACDGRWMTRHWSYGFLDQLARRVERCKEGDAQIDAALLAFIDQELFPRIDRERAALS